MFKSKIVLNFIRISTVSAFCSSLLLIAGNVYADALWYALESGSKVVLANGYTTELTGRIALLGCGGEPVDTKTSKRPYIFHAIKFDNAPEELEPQIQDTKSSHVPLFGGSGVGVISHPVMTAQRDGKVNQFEWNLQHKLEQDYGSEAVVYGRKLMIDSKKDSKLTFHDQQQFCPDTIKLSLVLKDSHITYQSEVTTSPTGEQVNIARPKSALKEEVVGNLTIIATAIPGSEEKVASRIAERPIAIDDAGHRNSVQQGDASNGPMTQPAQNKGYRVRQKAILNVQPNSQVDK